MCGVGFAISKKEGLFIVAGAIILSPVLLAGGAVYLAGVGVATLASKITAGQTEAEIRGQGKYDHQSNALNDVMKLHDAVTKEVGDDALQENIRLLFAEASKPDPSFQVLLSLGAALYLDGDYLVAERYLVEAVKRGEDATTGPIQLGGARHLLGMTLVRQGDFLGAESAFRAAAQALRYASDLSAAKGSGADDARDATALQYAVDPVESEYQAAYAFVLFAQHPGIQRTNSFRVDVSNPATSAYTEVPKPDRAAAYYIPPLPLEQVLNAVHRMEIALSGEMGTANPEAMMVLAGTLFWASSTNNCDYSNVHDDDDDDDDDDDTQYNQTEKKQKSLELKAAEQIDKALRALIAAGAKEGSASAAALWETVEGTGRVPRIDQAAIAHLSADHPNATSIARALSLRSQIYHETPEIAMEMQVKAKELDPNVIVVDIHEVDQLWAAWPLPSTHGAAGSIGAHEWEEVQLKRPHWCSQCGNFITLSENMENVFRCVACDFIVHRGDCKAVANHCLSNVTIVPTEGAQVYLYGDKQVHTIRSVDSSTNFFTTDRHSYLVPVQRIRCLASWSNMAVMQAHHHTFHSIFLHKPTWCTACSGFISSLRAMRCDVCAKIVHEKCESTVDGALRTD